MLFSALLPSRFQIDFLGSSEFRNHLNILILLVSPQGFEPWTSGFVALIPVQRTAWVQAPIRQIDLVGWNGDGAQRTFDSGSGVVAHSLAICIGDVTGVTNSDSRSVVDLSAIFPLNCGGRFGVFVSVLENCVSRRRRLALVETRFECVVSATESRASRAALTIRQASR